MKDLKAFALLTVSNIKLQHRQGFTAAWLVISLFYILGLYFLPENLTAKILPLILLSEPSTFAMIFTGAILLLERDEGLLENLFITPLPVKTYMLAKALALSLPAMGSTLLISLVLAPLRWSLLLVLPGVFLTTLFFSLFTFIPASASRDIMSLIGRIGFYGYVFTFSILDYFGILKGWYQYILPSKGTLILMTMAVGKEPGSPLELIPAFASLAAGILVILPLAEKSFYKNLILQGAPR
ncbi:hypothetical protein [Oceanispirochaeta sp.]|jgi:fluoroquinolone transport system permease protein|uniref:fluoroquinolone export ABC transporter permease subunit n=1 Tax=Oceanispirochaeta sp. TaxID=2035350 RepID=UPI0026108669|nr:hypothetical protein [Oceanispirochaeta sp.]MDA3955421.1 hypothetical protein [Oceanispirochaeta sp.]